MVLKPENAVMASSEITTTVQRIVGQNSQKKQSWLLYCKMRPYVVEHPGIFNRLNLFLLNLKGNSADFQPYLRLPELGI